MNQKLRATLISDAVYAFHRIGYDQINADNILADPIYAGWFGGWLKKNGNSYGKSSVTVRELLKEIDQVIKEG